MALLHIKQYPDVILKKKSISVINIDNNIHKLINDMVDTMYRCNGIGLAAPQIGILKRVIVFDLNSDEQSFSSLINPRIVKKNNILVSENEGCLSVPGVIADVKRYKNIVVEGFDKNEEFVSLEVKDRLSIVLQHEIDHLNGVLFIDRLSNLKKNFYKKRLVKYLSKKE